MGNQSRCVEKSKDKIKSARKQHKNYSTGISQETRPDRAGNLNRASCPSGRFLSLLHLCPPRSLCCGNLSSGRGWHCSFGLSDWNDLVLTLYSRPPCSLSGGNSGAAFGWDHSARFDSVITSVNSPKRFESCVQSRQLLVYSVTFLAQLLHNPR